ncbi:hypothetical protein L1D34_14415 [Vibrio mediterranei]|uniref:hypothetical protein n=1 Tax=Vibrio mediterranei TaxID=689 RepID=UPI001EFD0198|nr:hypothetical protein [Vibrio mediterranei]MCG9626031.1 hypothetical protein [Vibrio mediterranei]
MSDLKTTNPGLYEIARRNGTLPRAATSSRALPNGPQTVADLKQSYPGLYAECISLGVTQERERILATLPTTFSNDRMKFAAQCVREGAPFNETAKANYLAMTLSDAKNDNQSDQVVAAIEKRLGVRYDT